MRPLRDHAIHTRDRRELLHDIGKLKTVGELRRPRHALIVCHEFASLEMLAPHLAGLEQRNGELAMAPYMTTPDATLTDFCGQRWCDLVQHFAGDADRRELPVIVLP